MFALGVPECYLQATPGRQNSLFFWVKNSGICNGCCGSQPPVYPDAGDHGELGTGAQGPMIYLCADRKGLESVWLPVSAKSMEGLEGRRPSPGDADAALSNKDLPSQILDEGAGPSLCKLLV